MSDNDERMKNFLIFKIWATNKELEEMSPVIGIVTLIILLGVGGIWLLSKLGVL